MVRESWYLLSPYGSVYLKIVFVTDKSSNSVVKFLKSGDYVCDSKSQNKDTQLDIPSSLCVLNQSVYVCDNGKHRVALFNFDLLFIKSFGESKLRYPEDIKIYKNTIFVLTQSDNSIQFGRSKLVPDQVLRDMPTKNG